MYLKQGMFAMLFCFSVANPGYALPWHPIVTVGAGVALSTHVGRSVYFPSPDPTVFEFYNYSASYPMQASVLGNVFLGLETKLKADKGLQLGLDFTQASPFNAQGKLLQGADLSSADLYRYYYHVRINQFLAAGKFFWTYQDYYHPYLFAGIGASYIKASSYSTTVPPNLTFTRQFSDQSMSSFSYGIGIGLDVDLSSFTRVGIGYRFTDLGNAGLGRAMIDTTPVSGTLRQSHLYTHEMMAQLTWIFS